MDQLITLWGCSLDWVPGSLFFYTGLIFNPLIMPRNKRTTTHNANSRRKDPDRYLSPYITVQNLIIIFVTSTIKLTFYIFCFHADIQLQKSEYNPQMKSFTHPLLRLPSQVQLPPLPPPPRIEPRLDAPSRWEQHTALIQMEKKCFPLHFCYFYNDHCHGSQLRQNFLQQRFKCPTWRFVEVLFNIMWLGYVIWHTSLTKH